MAFALMDDDIKENVIAYNNNAPGFTVATKMELDFSRVMIKELENIKAEISELLESSAWQYDVRRIIDKHISELKGETHVES